MNGSAKVKLLAVAIVAVLAVCAAAIAFVVPSGTESSEEEPMPEIVSSGKEAGQSESLKMLLSALNMCNFYIGEVDESEYTYVFGDGGKDGTTLDVGTNNVFTGSVLLNSNAVVDFSDSKELIMDGADICINGTNIRFISSDNKSFTVTFQSGAGMKIGPNIELGTSSSLVSTPFTIGYSNKSSQLFNGEGVLNKTLKVDSAFSINLDDNVSNGSFRIAQYANEITSQHEYRETDTTYNLVNRSGSEVNISIKCDFTEYYKTLSEAESGTSQESSFTFTEWLEYYFLNDHAIPDAAISFDMNGLSMEIDYEEEYISQYLSGDPYSYAHREGVFTVSNVNDLEFSMNSSNKDKYQEISASVSILKYNNDYTEWKKAISGSKLISNTTTGKESATVSGFEFSTMDSALNVNRTTIDLTADSITVDTSYDREKTKNVMKYIISAIDANVVMNKDHVQDLYAFVIQTFAGGDLLDTLLTADYTAVLCDAVVASSCDHLSIKEDYLERAPDSENKLTYVPYESSLYVPLNDIKFNCNYDTSNETKIEFDMSSSASMTEKHRSMESTTTGYTPTLIADESTFEVSFFSMESKFELPMLNKILEYVVSAADGEDTSDIQLKDIETKMNISRMEISDVNTVWQAPATRNNSNWDRRYNEDSLLNVEVDRITSTVDIDGFSLEKKIELSQEEIGYISFDSVDVSVNDDDVQSSIYDLYCDIDSQKPKMVTMSFGLVRGLSGSDPVEGLENFVYEYILDDTNLDMTVSLNTVKIDYANEIKNGNARVISSDELHILIGEEKYSGSGKAVTVTMDLNAGNGLSKIGYHNSSATISMSDKSVIYYSMEHYTTHDGTTSEECLISGLNGVFDIDTMVHADVTLESDTITTSSGFERMDIVKETSTITNVHTVADFKYDKVFELREFVSSFSNSEDLKKTEVSDDYSTVYLSVLCHQFIIPVSALESEEFSELFSEVKISMTCDRGTYKAEGLWNVTVADYSYEDLNGEEHVIENCVFEMDYLNGHYLSVEFDHISSASYDYSSKKSEKKTDYNVGRTECHMVSMDLYDVKVYMDTELSGLNDYISYVRQFMTGKISENKDKAGKDFEYFDMITSMEIKGRNDTSEYKTLDVEYDVYRSFDSINGLMSSDKSGLSADENCTFRNVVVVDFDYITVGVIMGTTGMEQISLTADSFLMKMTYVDDATERDKEIVLNIDYIEASVGTDSKSMYKLATALLAYKKDKTKLDADIKSALVSFVTDNTNTKFMLRLTSGEFYIKDKVGITGIEHKISIPKSDLERYALVIEGSLKIVYTEKFDFTMNGTYLKMDMAEDSKIVVSNSQGGNIYLEYFEFSNMDAAFNVSATVSIGELTQYIGDEDLIIKCVTDSILIKGVITADSGKYTSIRTDDTYYKIQIGSDEDLMIKIDSNLSNLMSLDDLSDTVFMEGGESYIQSEYTDDSGTVREIFRFDQFRTYYKSREFIVESDSVDATVTIGNKTYGMKTDGTVYFNSTLPSLKGYSIVDNGVLRSDEGYGISPTIKVSTFTVRDDSVLYAGKTFVKGTELALTEANGGEGNFAGWRINNVLIPKDKMGATVYYAPMDDNVTISYVYGYILTYKSNDSDGWDSVLRSVVLDAYDSIDLDYTPARAGFTFDKWNTTHTSMPTYNLTICAIWIPNTYKLTIDYGDGSPVEVSDIKYDVTIAEPKVPEREGYTFSGWLGYKKNMVMPAYDLTIRALWSRVVTSDQITADGNDSMVDVGADIADIDKNVIEEMVTTASNSNGSLSMNFSGASITMGADSLKKLSYDEITGKASGIRMSVTKSELISDSMLKRMTSDDKDKLANIKYAISIDVSTNGCTSGLGTVTVTVPVDDSYAGSTFIVYYISTDGTVTPIDAECKSVNGQTCIVFETDHFSYFAFLQTSAAVEESEESSSSPVLMYVIIGVICLLIVGIIVFVVLKRRYII